MLSTNCIEIPQILVFELTQRDENPTQVFENHLFTKYKMQVHEKLFEFIQKSNRVNLKCFIKSWHLIPVELA